MARVRGKNSTNVRANLVRFGVGVAQGISTDLAGRVAEELFVTPMRGPRPERERGWLATAERIPLSVDGQELAAWAWGDRDDPPVLLVHGWAGRGAQLGALAPPLLDLGFRVIAFDAPAHGSSPGRRLTLVAQARAVAAAAEAVGGRLEGVVAHSFGAAAVTLAMARGLRVERVAFLAPVVRVEDAVRRFVRWARLAEDAEAEFRRRLAQRAGATVAEVDAIRLAEAMTTPLLVVHDEDDREVPTDEGRAIAGRWPGAAFHATNGLGHHHILRDPDVVFSVCRWLASGVVPRPVTEELERELFIPALRLAGGPQRS